MNLAEVVPWGRNMQEYKRMFMLTPNDLNKNMISVGDGPASFNQEMRALGKSVISVDPIYHFSKEEIKKRIEETRRTILEQMSIHHSMYVWDDIRSIDELEKIRLDAMALFLDDYESDPQRYLPHRLPDPLPFISNFFDLSLSSHFLFLYDELGVDFHIRSITEMMRVSYEARFFPIVNLSGERSRVLEPVLSHFSSMFDLSTVIVPYQFQKGANEMLLISKELK